MSQSLYWIMKIAAYKGSVACFSTRLRVDLRCLRWYCMELLVRTLSTKYINTSNCVIMHCIILAFSQYTYSAFQVFGISLFLHYKHSPSIDNTAPFLSYLSLSYWSFLLHLPQGVWSFNVPPSRRGNSPSRPEV